MATVFLLPSHNVKYLTNLVEWRVKNVVAFLCN